MPSITRRLFLAAGIATSLQSAARAQQQPLPPTDLRIDGEAPVSTGVLPLGALTQDAQTVEQIALYLPITGQLDEAFTASVRFRQATVGTWSAAPDLWRIEPQWSGIAVNEAFAGVIFGLSAGQSYDVEVKVSNGATEQVFNTTFSTRSLPRLPSGAPIQVTTLAALQAAINSAQPGTVIEIPANTTITLTGNVININGISGTAADPIFIRGANRATSRILQSNGDTTLYFIAAKHVVVEDLTLQGYGTDVPRSNGTGVVEVFGGGQTDFLCFRRLNILRCNKGITCNGFDTGHLIYDCVLEGNNTWNQANIESNATWNDDGVRVGGSAHCVFNNDFSGFGDTIGFVTGTVTSLNKCNFFYRNKIVRAGDDGIEAEYSHRNNGIYDNYILNAMTALSIDGLHGGPLYYFRNRAINIGRSIVKCGDWATGVLIWSNTFVKKTGMATTPDGIRGWYWPSHFSGTRPRDWEYRNNLFLWEGSNQMLLFESVLAEFTPWQCTHNGWGRNGQAISYGGAGASGAVAAVNSVLSPIHDNDIEIANQAAVFAAPVVFPANYHEGVTQEYTLELKSSSPTVGKGLVIPTISTSGDIGAYGFGEVIPEIGARI